MKKIRWLSVLILLAFTAIGKIYADPAGAAKVRVSNLSSSVGSEKVQGSLAPGSDIPGWTWRYPLPQGNSLSDVVYSKGRFITVGGHGTVLTSDDGVVWTSRSTGTTNNLRKVVEGGGKLVAAGVEGTILVSDDGGLSWNPAESGTTETLGVSYVNNRFYVLSYVNTVILTSTDGLHWEKLTVGPITYPQNLFSINGQLYLSCFPGRLYRSNDGITWELVFEDSLADNVSYGAGVFLMTKLGEIWSSVDAKNWVLRRPNGERDLLSHPVFLSREFAALATSGYIIHSPDGVTWTDSPAFPPLENLQSLGYGGGTYVAVGTSGLIYGSKDLVKWTRQTAADSRWILGIASGPQGFVGVDALSGLPQHSDDGVLWKPAGKVYIRTQITRYVNNTYVSGATHRLYFSTDGFNWTAPATPPDFSIENVAYGAGKYVVVGGTLHLPPTKPTADLSTSTDLQTWSSQKFEQFGLLRGVVWDGSRFVAVGERGTMLTSPDGVNWQQQTGLTAQMSNDDLRTIAYDGKQYVVGGGFGPTLYSSTDLKTWNTFIDPRTDISGAVGFQDVIYAAGRFMALYVDGSIFSSVDGATWTPVDCGVSGQADCICYGKDTFVVSGYGYLVQSGPLTPSLNSIAVTPSRQLVPVGQPARFDADTTGHTVLSYQWLKDGNEIPGANGPSLQFARISGTDAGVYQVRVRNDSGQGTSFTGYLATAEVSLSPGSEGGQGTININAPDGVPWGVGGLSDWFNFTRSNTGIGSGKVAFTTLPNPGGSRSTLLTIGDQPLRISQLGQSPAKDETESRLINLSSRGRLDGSGQPIIAGFVISGSTPKRVLLRAVGPSLADFAIKDPLSNPRIHLFNSAGTLIQENDDWGTSTDDIPGWTARAGAFPLHPGTHDAATVATLPPGPYTVHVDGISSDLTGVVLVEMYEALAPEESLDDRRLINISTLSTVTQGEGVLIAGFIISGSAPRRVLIRGVGPGLTDYGVNNPIADPVIELHNSSTTLATNDNWETPNGTEVSAATAKSGAFALHPGSRDSAIVTTLTPGTYTVILSGASGSTGRGLIEVYEVAQ